MRTQIVCLTYKCNHTPDTYFQLSSFTKFSLTWAILSVKEEHKASLEDILRYSPFNKEDDILAQIEAISSHGSETGTRIIIWNLRRSQGSSHTQMFMFYFGDQGLVVPVHA